MRIRPLLTLLPLLLAFAAPALGRGTLDSILPQIRAAHPGRLSDAQPWTGNDGATHYRIKWMTPEGRIIYFDADTRTGRYFSAGGDEANQWRNRRFDGQDNQDNGHRGDRWTGDEDGGRRGRWNDDGDDRGGAHGGDGHGHDNGAGDWHGRGGRGDWGGGHDDNHHHGH